MALTKEDLLALSTMLDEKLEPIHNEINDVKAEVKGMKTEIAGIQTEIKGMKQRITAIELRIENELVSDISFIAENVIPAAKKYEREAEKIESMQADIDVMKGVLKEHSKILQNIS